MIWEDLKDFSPIGDYNIGVPQTGQKYYKSEHIEQIKRFG